jgi:hypothetical protein
MSDESPIRFDAIDPTRTRRYENVVAGIVRAAAPRLARRRTSRTPLAEIERMYRPLLAAAAAVLIFVGLRLSAPASPTAVVDTLALAEEAPLTDMNLLFVEDNIFSLEDLLEQQHEESR